MNKGLVARLLSLLSRRQLKERLAHIAMVLSCAAVFCVTYMLVAPVLTQEWPAVCGMEEHVHTDECYAVELVEIPSGDSPQAQPLGADLPQEPAERRLTCELEETEGHAHGESCYETETVLVCELPEDENHTHDDSCYESRTSLTCELEESEGHTHSESCYETVTPTPGPDEEPAPSAPQYQEVRVLICGKEEHTHTDECFTPPEESKPKYLCGYDIQHVHDESCYFEDGTLKCTIPEHTHTEACLPETSPETPETDGDTPEDEPPSEPEASIFPAALPEGYVEAEVFQPMAVFAMDADEDPPAAPDALVYVPQDAFDVPVLFVPQPIYDEETAQALADELAAAGVEFDGLTALDLSFFDEDYAEQEPLTGPVYVKLTLNQELPEEAQPQLWHMTENGVEAVATDVDYDAESQILTLGFAVDSFSGFTITWKSSSWSSSGQELAAEFYDIQDLSKPLDVTGKNLTVNSYDGVGVRDQIETIIPDGYALDHLAVGTTDMYDITVVRSGNIFSGYTYTWKYQRYQGGDWNDLSTYTPSVLMVICKKNVTANLNIAYGKYVNDEFQTLSGGDPASVALTAGEVLTLSDLKLTLPAGYELDRFETDLGSSADSVVCGEDGKLTFMNGKETVNGTSLRAVCEIAAHNWTGDARNRVRCFVSITYQVLGATGEFNAPAPSSEWTSSVYETYVVGSKGYEGSGSGSYPGAYIAATRSGDYNEYYIARDPNDTTNSTKNLLEAYQHILNAATDEGYTNTFANPSANTEATYWLQSLPSDEEVLAAIQKELKADPTKIITGPDGKVDPEDLNTDEFAIRWFSFKFRGDDYWHLDGVLVKTEGHLAVTKTFSGDKAAIEAVKSGAGADEFYISVSEAQEKEENETDLYRLYPDRVEMRQSNGTYAVLAGVTPTVSSDGLNYAWALDTANVGYHIMEHNYTYNSTKISTVTEYRFSNLDPADQNDGYHNEHWTTFVSDPGLNLTGRSYAPDITSDQWQTVHFRNRYLPANALILHTADQETGEPLPNVEFSVTADGKPLTLWLMDGIYYFYRPQGYDGMSGGIQQCSTARVSDAGELVFGGVGQDGTTNLAYVLTERSRPAGYSEASLHFTINGNGTIQQSKEQQDASISADPVERVESGNVYLTTLYHTVTKGSITAKKVWSDGKGHTSDTVTLTLHPTGKTLVLNEKGWSGTFGNDFPLYDVNGRINYTITEKVTTNGADTTASYAVTVAREDTTDADGTITAANFTVTNAASDTASAVSFRKVAEGNTTQGLSGAEFRLYDHDGKELGSFISDANGTVNIPTLPKGDYRLKETKAPDGYVLSGVTYKVNITGKDAFTIQADDTNPSNGMGISADGKTYYIFNRSAYVAELPATGGSGLLLWYAAGLSLILGAAFLMYKGKKRKEGSACP